MIERTFDYRRVQELLNHYPVISEEFYYLLDGNNLWSFHPDGDDLRIHANLNDLHGKDAVSSAKEAFHYIFNHTLYKRIVARIPKENVLARVIARECMTLFKKDERYHYEVKKCLN